MSIDPFSSVGESFRRECLRNDAARDQAMSALNDLAEFCADGIRSFYDSVKTDAVC